jgi:16S rRNA (uracil1498-N3)-methyltransferase
MQLFYTTEIDTATAVLTGEEARHCVQVLRKRVGDSIHIVDGKGGMYEGLIAKISGKECIVDIQKNEQQYGKRPFYLHIAIAPTKNIARFEWFLEKAAEIGIDEITPIRCARSEREKLRLERLDKILVSAMKQSLKAYLPRLNPLASFEELVGGQVNAEARFIAWCAPAVNTHLKDNYLPGQSVCILIGPEGDFTDREVHLAFDNGFKAVSLGKSRLRTETAGLAACHTVNLLND